MGPAGGHGAGEPVERVEPAGYPDGGVKQQQAGIGPAPEQAAPEHTGLQQVYLPGASLLARRLIGSDEHHRKGRPQAFGAQVGEHPCYLRPGQTDGTAARHLSGGVNGRERERQDGGEKE